MKLNWNFLGGGEGGTNKNLPWGEFGNFLELHNPITVKYLSLTPLNKPNLIIIIFFILMTLNPYLTNEN